MMANRKSQIGWFNGPLTLCQREKTCTVSCVGLGVLPGGQYFRPEDINEGHEEFSTVPLNEPAKHCTRYLRL
jgi:hypothetical protein